jgi:hypothetical protein
LFFKDYQFESYKTSEPLEAYIVVNFKARVISWGARKLARTTALIKKQSLDISQGWVELNFY